MAAEPLDQIPPPIVPGPDRGKPPVAHPPLWAQRLLLVVEVAVAVWAGLLVIVLPWTRLWTQNPLLAHWPILRLVLASSFVRGVISGIGLVDVWIGFSDALHYRDLH